MRIRIEGLEEFQADINKAVGMFPSVVRTAMDKSTRHIKERVQDNITNQGIHAAVNTPAMVDTVHTKTSSYRGEVFVGAEYGIFVEKGTRPHFPPVEALTGKEEMLDRWARIKLRAPGAGFVIARKIARVGTKANPFFAPAVEKSVSYVNKTFEKTIDVLIKAMAGK